MSRPERAMPVSVASTQVEGNVVPLRGARTAIQPLHCHTGRMPLSWSYTAFMEAYERVLVSVCCRSPWRLISRPSSIVMRQPSISAGRSSPQPRKRDVLSSTTVVVAECEHLVALHGRAGGSCSLVLAVDEGEGLACHVGVAGLTVI